MAIPKRRLTPFDVASAVGIILLGLYLAFFEEDTPLDLAHEVQIISGRAEIVDGDSLTINGERIRLAGIDAPEMRQFCQDEASGDMPCGRLAKQHLEELVHNRPVTCRWQTRDRYDRILGICQAGNDDLNRLMVEDGWALSYYSSAYNNEQKLARNKKRGMWRWKVQQPQQWRREHLRL